MLIELNEERFGVSNRHLFGAGLRPKPSSLQPGVLYSVHDIVFYLYVWVCAIRFLALTLRYPTLHPMTCDPV